MLRNVGVKPGKGPSGGSGRNRRLWSKGDISVADISGSRPGYALTDPFPPRQVP